MKNDREMLELAAKARHAKERHGLNKTPEHQAWVSMRQRCNNPNKKEYIHYGGRGIVVCTRWSYFLNFLEDMGKRPSKKHSIDRIDVNGNYEPGNVRWATKQIQAENTTVAKFLSHADQNLTISEWERRCGFARGTISRRLASGWSVAEAIDTKPVIGHKVHPEPVRDVSHQNRGSYGEFVRAAEIGKAMP